MEKQDIEQQKLEVEKVKVSIERGKIIEGQIRTLVIVLVAVIGGVVGMILSFDSYPFKSVVTTLISLGIFFSGLLIYLTLDLWFELERLKERWKRWRH